MKKPTAKKPSVLAAMARTIETVASRLVALEQEVAALKADRAEDRR